MAPRTVRDVIGPPERWPNYLFGGSRMPTLRGARIRSTRLIDPAELQVSIEVHGQVMSSTFELEDRDLRMRVYELLKPGADLASCLDQAL